MYKKIITHPPRIYRLERWSGRLWTLPQPGRLMCHSHAQAIGDRIQSQPMVEVQALSRMEGIKGGAWATPKP